VLTCTYFITFQTENGTQKWEDNVNIYRCYSAHLCKQATQLYVDAIRETCVNATITFYLLQLYAKKTYSTDRVHLLCLDMSKILDKCLDQT
jgi:hypothetical protein